MSAINCIDFVLFESDRIVIDLRDAISYKKDHFPESINVPIGDISNINSLDNYLISLPSNAVVHCYDSHGEYSITFKNHRSIHYLKDGYKALKNWGDAQFLVPSRLCVLGGYTGAMKTETLQQLAEKGEQIIDFEMLSNHKGSAFGNLEKKVQPTAAEFYISVLRSWLSMDHERIVWVEEEGPFIGRNTIPQSLYNEIIRAPMLDLVVSFDERLTHIVKEYTLVNPDAFQQAIKNLEKRLGTSLTHKALHLHQTRQLKECVKILLTYYDRGYKHRRASNFKGKITAVHRVDFTSDELLEKLIQLSGKLH